MTINTSDPITIRIPRITGNLFVGTILITVVSLTIFFLGGLFLVRVRHANLPPPKVITKTITISEASYAMQVFVERCESSENNYQDHGIPNVHTNNWTCTYADPTP